MESLFLCKRERLVWDTVFVAEKSRKVLLLRALCYCGTSLAGGFLSGVFVGRGYTVRSERSSRSASSENENQRTTVSRRFSIYWVKMFGQQDLGPFQVSAAFSVYNLTQLPLSWQNWNCQCLECTLVPLKLDIFMLVSFSSLTPKPQVVHSYLSNSWLQVCVITSFFK